MCIVIVTRFSIQQRISSLASQNFFTFYLTMVLAGGVVFTGLNNIFRTTPYSSGGQYCAEVSLMSRFFFFSCCCFVDLK